MLRSVALLTVVVLAATCGVLPPPLRSGSLDPLAGTYRAAGSGAALESLTALTKRFSQLHPGAVFRLEDVNAETSVVLVFEGEVDLGFLSRDLRPEERGKVLLVPYAGTGTGLAVNPANPVIGLTRDQVRKIFSGEITDWATVGGTPGQIRVYLREQGSATRASFEAYFFGAKPAYVPNAVEVVESAAT